MNQESLPKCPQCGAPIKENAPGGLCPTCLMALNLQTETVIAADAPPRQSTRPAEEIAPHFPQLEILEYLGRGGMGVVYKARQKTLNRFVALKLLAPERVKDPKFADRFAREAHALAALNHPNIVTVHDFGQAGGFYFLLMEFVDGVNLRELLRAQKFTPEEALTIVPPLCDALQFAHEHGIVHRDIKPENILLDKAGRVKVADFGIAKMLGADHGENSCEPLLDKSRTHSAIGTPGYIAPEQQAAPQRVDSRADIYSLGVVFYEMLTGELPGKRIEAPSKKVQIDVRLDEIVLRAMEKQPELRYQTADQLKTQLATLAIERTKGQWTKAPESPQSPVPNRSLAAVIAIVISLALLAAAILRPDFLSSRSSHDSAPLPALANVKSRAAPQRVLYFPADRSLGTLFIRSARTNWVLTDLLTDWREFAEARGKVEIPAGREARLDVSAEGAKDLSPLASLAPDALRAILFLRSKADEACLKQVGRLTGLKYLRLQDEKVTDEGIAHCAGLRELVCLSADTTQVGNKGLKTIGRLNSLQRLQLAYTPVSDQGLAELVGLKLLRYLRLDRTAITDAGMVHLQNLSGLCELHLAESAITDKSLDYLSKLPNVEELDLSSTAISDRNLGVLKKMSRLKSLSLTRTAVTDAGLAELAALKALEELTVPARITDEGIQRLNGSPSLKKLDLAGTEVTGKCLASLNNLPSLTRLSLSDKIEDDDLAHLRSFPRLEELWLQNAPITDQGIRHVAALKSLKELFLGRLQVTDAGYAMLKQLSALEYLYLNDQGGRHNYESGIGDEGLTHISLIPTLRYLDLTRSRVTDLGLASLKRLPRLESLILEGTRVHGEGLAELHEMRTLREVDLSNTDISSAGVDALLSLPSLEFLNLRRVKIAPNDLLRLQAGISSARLLVSLKPESQTAARRLGPQDNTAGDVLELLAAAADTNRQHSAASSVFQPVIQRAIGDVNDSRTNASMIDLDSGKVFSISIFGTDKPFVAAFEAGLKRIRSEGIDLFGDTSGKTFIGFETVLVPAEQPFDLLTADRIAADQRLAAPAQAQVEINVQDPPATYLFKTREGGRGILEVMSFSENLDSMKIRYKLVRPRRQFVRHLVLLSARDRKRFFSLKDARTYAAIPGNAPVLYVEKRPDRGWCVIVENAHNYFTERIEGTKLWESMSAEEISQPAGVAGLPFERKGIYELHRARMPITVLIPEYGLLQISGIDDRTEQVIVEYKHATIAPASDDPQGKEPTPQERRNVGPGEL